MRLVVTGEAGAGKTTLANELAGPDCVIIDYDALAYALGSRVNHRDTPHRPAHRTAAELAWRALVRPAQRGDLGGDVIVIHAAPEPWAVAMYRSHGFTIREL